MAILRHSFLIRDRNHFRSCAKLVEVLFYGSLFARYQSGRGIKCAFATGQLAGADQICVRSDQSQRLLRSILLLLILYVLEPLQSALRASIVVLFV